MSYLTALFFACMLFLTSCSIKNDYAELQYPKTHTQATPTKFLCIEVNDGRKQPDVGYIKNIIGMKTGRILSKTPVSSIFYESIVHAFAAKSIAAAPSSLKLFVTIEECFSSYSTGIFLTKAEAKICLDVHLVNEEGVSLYKATIEEQGIETPVFFYSGKNTGAALSKALKQAVETLSKEVTPYITKNKTSS